MYALRERRQHVTQEDFEMSVAKVRSLCGSTLRYDTCAERLVAPLDYMVLTYLVLFAGAAQNWGRIDVELEAVQLEWRRG